ncbi:MAG: phytanoyl-CoA dioxygenase family protein [Planctomycetota bacterium]|jgi:hypothetical protein|nr:phytanoyl-CoA dioxygenase family protein [Planctomycetota bacterium]MDP7130501.1 phytanoyl-CoA dioxygenase family protein [Planctomycetota bacterium]MDP7251387.1 phytanoyl-CoA dioxygenase family protein [Planctomycetota bacterium]
MIETIIGDYPTEITQQQVDFIDRENFYTFGKILTDDEIIEGRFAYARVWEANPLAEEQRAGDGVPGHPSMKIESYCHEPALAKLIANEYILRIASAALHTPVDELVYVDGYMHRQRLYARWDYCDWSWDGWHLDGAPNIDPLTHCNVWMYFNDCTRDEGVTQALLGGCEKQRENIRAGYPDGDRWEPGNIQDGIQAMIDEVGHDPDKGTWAVAPAGGGLAWGGFLWHRIAPNRSGINRTLVTYEYAPRSADHKTEFKDRTTAELRESILPMLPDDKHYLLDY